ncbi:MAG: hypothetical protein RL213_1740 [Bacteroidota bacterium]|jgi:ABC-2 type transport system ATP-binding protein
MTPVLEVSGLVKSYHVSSSGGTSPSTRNAVDHLGFSVLPGDIYGFLGPNGAGKSTTIRMLLGLVRPDSGDISYFGRPFRDSRSASLSRIGAIVEKPDFYRYLSALKNLEIFGSMSGADISSGRLESLLELVGLSGRGKEPVKNYSHGMKQRLGIAQALLHDPELILLDEPTTGLDPQGIVDLRELLVRLKHEGKTVFMSSHILSEVELIATRMVIVSNGRAVKEGSVRELLDADDLLVDFGFHEIEAARKALSGSFWEEKLEEVLPDALRFRLDRQQTSSLNAWFCAQGVAPAAIVSKRRLEDFFMKLTR